MNCKNCGFPLTNENERCPSCGTPNEMFTGVQPTMPAQNTEVPTGGPVVPEVPTVPVAPSIPSAPTETVQEAPTTSAEPIPPIQGTQPVQAEPIQQMQNTEPVYTQPQKSKKGKTIAIIIIAVVAVLALLGVGIAMALKALSTIKSNETEPNNQEEPVVEEKATYDIAGYTFELPDGYYITNNDDTEILTGTYFSVRTGFMTVQEASYEAIKSAKSTVAAKFEEYLTKSFPDIEFEYLGAEEETYGTQSFIVFSFLTESDEEDAEYHYDTAYTELPDGTPFVVEGIVFESGNKQAAYEDLAELIQSAKAATATTDDSKIVIDAVVGNSTAGYLKLPGKWLEMNVIGASDTALQYMYMGSDANGNYIVTLDTIDATSDPKAAADASVAYQKTDSDVTNLKMEQTKIGSYDAYKVTRQYISDGVWVSAWYLKGTDGVVHLIEVEGPDTSNDIFKIPSTFSFTK